MRATVSLDEAQLHLKELIDRLQPGDELVITDNDQPIARLVGPATVLARPRPGLGKGEIL